MKLAIVLASLVAITGCATSKCGPSDYACQAKEENNRRAALMMFSNMGYGVAQNARERQNFYQAQQPNQRAEPVAQETWQPTVINPNRWGGTTYCNSQGICQLKRY